MIEADKATCDNCGEDITPECKAAKEDGHEEGYRAAFKVISDMFKAKKINRTKLKEIDLPTAIALLDAIHYTVNY